MKKNAIVLFISLAAFCGGSMVAQIIYPFFVNHYRSGVPGSPDDSNAKADLNQSESNADKWEQMTVSDAAKRIIAMPDEQLEKEIMLLFSSRKDTVGQFYARWMIQRFVRNMPDKAIAVLLTKTFREAGEGNRVAYAWNIAGSFAKFYPDRFINDVRFINEKGPVMPSLNFDLIWNFLYKLAQINPTFAYRLMTDGSMEPVFALNTDKRYSVTKVENIQSMLPLLEREIVIRMGFSAPELLAQTFSGLNENERYSFINELTSSLSQSEYDSAISWANTYLDDNEQKQFWGIVLSRLLDESKNTVSAQKLLEYIGFEKVSDWQLNQYARIMAKTDPIQAIDFIEKKLSGYKREDALAGVLSELMRQKTPEEMSQIMAGLPEGACKDRTLSDFWAKYYSSSPDNALQWVIDNEDINLLRSELFREKRKGETESHEFQKRILTVGAEDPFAREMLIEQYRWDSKAPGEALIGELNGEKQRMFASDFYGDWLRNGNDPEVCVEWMKKSEVLGENKATVIREAIAEIAHTYPPDRLARSLSALDDASMLPYAAEQYVWTFDGKTVQDGTEPVLENTMKSDIPDNLKQAIRAAWEAKKNGAQKPQDFKKEIYWGHN